jgi:hypothetical protein
VASDDAFQSKTAFMDVLKKLFLQPAFFRSLEPVPNLLLQVTDLFQAGLHAGYQIEDGLWPS